jgi:misacylated tRNA(Ala) deacylase
MSIPLATLHPYVYEFDATVTHINEDGNIEFDKTYFYPTGGGQPNDLGIVKRNDEEFEIIDVRKKDGHIVHVVSKAGLVEGDQVHCIIDQERREKHRKMHTATHVLCAVIEKAENTKVTGNQIGTERTRIDFNLENYDVERLKKYIDEANTIIRSNIPVRKFVTSRDELLKNPDLVKLAIGFPENVTEVHMIEIGEFDIQPCGGTHVDSLNEIGTLVFDKSESKGKNNRRVSFTMQ